MAFNPQSKISNFGNFGASISGLGQSPVTDPSVFTNFAINYTSEFWTGETPTRVTKMVLNEIWQDVKRNTKSFITNLVSGTVKITPPAELDYISLNQPGVTVTETRLHNNEPDRISLSLKPYSLSKEVAILPAGAPVIVKGKNRKGTWLYIQAPDNLTGYVVAQRIKTITPRGGQGGGLPTGALVAGAAALYLISQG